MPNLYHIRNFNYLLSIFFYWQVMLARNDIYFAFWVTVCSCKIETLFKGIQDWGTQKVCAILGDKVNLQNVNSPKCQLAKSSSKQKSPCGLYYKNTTFVNYASSIVNKLQALLTDNAGVIIYDHHVLIVQATGWSIWQLDFFANVLFGIWTFFLFVLLRVHLHIWVNIVVLQSATMPCPLKKHQSGKLVPDTFFGNDVQFKETFFHSIIKSRTSFVI